MTYVHSLPHVSLPRYTSTITFIVGIHVAFVMMINRPVHIPRPPGAEQLIARFLPEQPKQQLPVPRLRPASGGVEHDPPHISSPAPSITIDLGDPPVSPTPMAPDDGVAPAIERDSVAPTLDPRHPIGEPEYPAQSERLGETGRVVINACVALDGRIASATVKIASGYARLDEAALRHMRRPGARMTPGREDGHPAALCADIPFRFTIRH